MNRNTSISLGAHFDDFIQSKISKGRYKNASEVVRAGLRLLEDEENKSIALRDAIQEGMDSGIDNNFEPKSHLKKLKAIKYTNDGLIEFGYTNKTDCIEFYVKDTGIGIPKGRQEAIFERFVQADIDDINVRQGAGLGLAIAKSYTEMLGGKIRVESDEGKGSAFYFTIPYNPDI